MKNFFFKYWYKFTNKQSYQDLKNFERFKKDLKIFEEKFENEINKIQKKIKTKKELSFLHSGENLAIKNKLFYKPLNCETNKFDQSNQFGHINVPIKKLEEFIKDSYGS